MGTKASASRRGFFVSQDGKCGKWKVIGGDYRLVVGATTPLFTIGKL